MNNEELIMKENKEISHTLLRILKEKREILNEEEKTKLVKFEEEKMLKYNPANLFKNRKNVVKNYKNNVLAEKTIIEYKEKNFLQKIFNKIWNLFKKN